MRSFLEQDLRKRILLYYIYSNWLKNYRDNFVTLNFMSSQEDSLIPASISQEDTVAARAAKEK